MDLAACDGIGQSQDGLITRRQALRVLTTSQIDSLVKRRIWHVTYPSVYRMNGVPDTWHRRVRAATMVERQDILASHHTAAYLLGLVEQKPRTIELLTPMSNSARFPDCTMHRTRRWHESMRTVVNGIPTTRPARTLVDIATSSSKKTLRDALDNAITLRIMRLDDFYEEYERIGPRKQQLCRIFDDILPKRTSQFERTESRREIDVLEWINDARLPLPVEQFRIPLGVNDTFRPDYAYPEYKIAIEVQSWRWHGGPSHYEKDAHKAIAAAALGWITLPVLPRPGNKTLFLTALRQLLASRALPGDTAC